MSELTKDTLVDGRYRLSEYKGSGSYGEVWLAHDEVLDLDVAVKVYISLDMNGVKDFTNEYKAAYGLHHPNLLTADYYSVWDHRPYLVMKYCSQGSVAGRAGRMNEKEIWRFVRDVSAGLAFLHKQEPDPIIHQDIKPDNILVDDNGSFLITDFGISVKLRSTMRKQSKRSLTAGATAYMGPERFEESPMLIKANDIWSLGASIYELASGELPFNGMGGGMQLNGGRRPKLDEQWSKELNETMRACLALNTWDRPMAEELSAYASAMVEGRPATPRWMSSGNKNKREGNGHENVTVDPRKTQRVGSETFDPGKTSQDGMVVKRRRHAVTSFFLYLWTVLSALAAIMWAVLSVFGVGQYSSDYYILPLLTASSLLTTFCYCLILSWKKVGFHLLWVTLFVSSVVGSLYENEITANLVAMSILIAGISMCIGMLIVYLILLIRKNGISTWKQLEPGSALSMKHSKPFLVFIAILTVGLLITGYIIDQSAQREWTSYVDLCNDCQEKIDEGGNTNVDALIEARQILANIYAVEINNLGENGYDMSSTLSNELDEKIDLAFNAWKRAAISQRDKAHNLSLALEYFNIAHSLKDDDEEVEEAIADLEHGHGPDRDARPHTIDE